MKSRPDVLVLLFFIFLASLLLGFLEQNELILCGPEQFFVTHPLQASWLSNFFNGRIPWMNRDIAGGIPLWADPNVAIFYPGNLLYLVLPFNVAWNAFLVFHLFWGTCGLYWLCRKLRLPLSAALAGALTFLFSGPFLAALNSNETLVSASWIPWIVGLTYHGLQHSHRRTFIAAIALSCQWLSGFHPVQALTALLVLTMALALCSQSKSRTIILWRTLLLFATAISLTAIQWLPAVAWFPNSGPESFFAETNLQRFPYLGALAALLFLFAFHRKIFWLAPIAMLIDYFLFGGSPFLSFVFALAAAFGTAWILHKYPKVLNYILPALIAIELLIVNWQVPQFLSERQLTNRPAILQEIPDFSRWNIHQSGTRGALAPVAGLGWGLKYGSPPQNGLMVWNPIESRMAAIEDRLRTGKNLQLLRDAGIVYVLSDVRFDHPELGLVSQKSTKFYVYRVLLPVSPLVVSSSSKDDLRWLEESSSSIRVTYAAERASELTIHRNALPGWRCKTQNGTLPVRATSDGWMKIEAPAGGKQNLQLSYRTPGAVAGTILTLIGTIFILAFLLL